MRTNASKAGFTLTEILIVISLMTILIALFVSRLAGPAWTQAKVGKTLQNFKTIRLAINKFKTDYGTAPALTPEGIQNTIGSGNDLMTWYETNDMGWTLPLSALHDGVKRNACLFLQLCVGEVTDDSGDKHKVGSGDPALPADKVFAARIKDSGDVIEENEGIYSVFVDAWGTPLRVSDQTVATNLTEDHNSTVDAIKVDSTADFPDSGRIVIDQEIIAYASKTATQFQSCTRPDPDSGTLAAGHDDKAAVIPYPRTKSTIVLESAGPDGVWEDTDDNLESNE